VKKPTDKQLKFADAKLSGLNDKAAARAAGYSNSGASATMAVTSKGVQTVLDEARQLLASATNLKKSDVLAGILDAIERARMLGEPSTEIKGWQEVAKMLGYYAPEVKRIELTTDQGRVKSKFEQMTDEELLEIALSNNTIDGSCERLQ